MYLGPLSDNRYDIVAADDEVLLWFYTEELRKEFWAEYFSPEDNLARPPRVRCSKGQSYEVRVLSEPEDYALDFTQPVPTTRASTVVFRTVGNPDEAKISPRNLMKDLKRWLRKWLEDDTPPLLY